MSESTISLKLTILPDVMALLPVNEQLFPEVLTTGHLWCVEAINA